MLHGICNNYYLVKDNPRNYLLITVGLNTAFRISDILKLKWKDVYNTSEKKYKMHIDVQEQKTGKQNMVAINKSEKKALKKL